MSANSARILPFSANHYQGQGSWIDRSGKDGQFTTEFHIVEQAPDTVVQITKRHFLNPDGTLQYEENSQTRFVVSRFVEVTIGADGNEHTGIGYLRGNYLHYDMDLAPDVHLENTHSFNGEQVELIGSSTNKGNYTIWSEKLTRV